MVSGTTATVYAAMMGKVTQPDFRYTEGSGRTGVRGRTEKEVRTENLWFATTNEKHVMMGRKLYQFNHPGRVDP